MTGRGKSGTSARATAALLAVAGAGVLACAAVALGGDAPAGAELQPDMVRLALPPWEPALGSATAPLTMVEFTDYQCPYCRRFQAEVWPKLKRDYIDTGKLRYIARDLPLEFHAAAAPAAEAAHCANEQGKFWEMHGALLGGPADLEASGIERRARAVGLDMGRFGECVARHRYARIIAAHAAQADAVGIRGTPGFIVGRAAHGELTGVRVEGAVPYDEFGGLLRELLAAQ
jgi:protein-disulfide isomerase